jgi:hypothetical protein
MCRHKLEAFLVAHTLLENMKQGVRYPSPWYKDPFVVTWSLISAPSFEWIILHVARKTDPTQYLIELRGGRCL